MSSTNYPMSSAGDMDDLPRTLRRERERQKAAASAGAGASGLSAAPAADYSAAHLSDDPVPAAVQRIEVPFFRLMLFFLKAVIAGIPALLLLVSLLWAGGHFLEQRYPDLLKMKIIVCSPTSEQGCPDLSGGASGKGHK